jgi:putative membrane protein
MKKTILSLSLLGALSMFAACSSTENKTEDSKEVAKDQNEAKFDDTNIEDDTKWAADAAEGGMLEVQLGKLAQTNAANPKIKEFGNMMMTDHSKAGDELKALAAKKNISLPTALGDKKQKDYNDLAAKKGADFDKAYADYMVSDHKEDIDDYQKEADKGKDAEMKAWAAGIIPTLQHHLQMAEAARDAVK